MTATTTARHLAAPTPRLNFQAVAPELYKAQAGINALLHESSLGIQLLELVFLRVSQINGCAFCVDMHTRELLSRGEDLQRPHFSEREMVELTYAIGSINVWNRLCAGFAAPVARKPIKA
jgi:AhpD family alkylhydroperoxidase